MTASLRGLAILAVIAALLGVLVLRAARQPPPAAIDRALLPGLEVDKITALTWDRSPAPAVTVTLGDPPAWSSGESHARADADRVRDVLAALRVGRWHRRADAAAAGQMTVQLSLVGPTPRVIGIGEELAGTEQQWVVVGEHALLVDRWVARALAPEALALRSRHPFEAAAQADDVRVDPDLLVERDPWRIEPSTALVPRAMNDPQRVSPNGAVLVRAELADALVRALAALEIVRLSHPPATLDPAALRITAGIGATLSPTCPDDAALAYLASSAGDGCVPRAAFDAVRAAVAALRGPLASTAEPRLAPGTVWRVELGDANALELKGAPSILGGPADPARVAELLAVLAAPQQIVALAPAAKPRGELHVAIARVRINFALLDGDLVRRDQDPFALKLSHEAWQVLARGATAYAERSLWAEEPTTIAKLAIDGVTYTRGAVIGEWTRSPAGPVDGARIEALATALASLDRDDTLSLAGFTPVHTVTLTLAALTGATGARVLEVAAPKGSSCAARTPKGTARLPPATCAAIAAAAK